MSALTKLFPNATEKPLENIEQGDNLAMAQHALDCYNARDEAMREALALIVKVMEDEESRSGAWGPDVTCVSYLKDAKAKIEAVLSNGQGGKS